MKLRPKTNRIGGRVARQLDRFLKNKVIDLSAVRQGKAIAEMLQKEIPRASGLAELHPAHAIYVFVENQISILAEILLQLDEIDPLAEAVNRAQDAYVPHGPPMSPLTTSYFTAWAFFDCGAGIDRETFGSILLHLRAQLGMHQEFASVVEKWQASRMGLYQLKNASRELVHLRELVTGISLVALNPTRYESKEDAIWYARVLPPPSASFSEHVVVTTPYEINAPLAQGWTTFLSRTLPKTKISDPVKAYQHLMKWGLERHYWHEYVFEAYAGHETDGIRLMGLPDVPESRPHSRINEDGRALQEYVASGRIVPGARA